jgi:hypothetical protein
VEPKVGAAPPENQKTTEYSQEDLQCFLLWNPSRTFKRGTTGKLHVQSERVGGSSHAVNDILSVGRLHKILAKDSKNDLGLFCFLPG